MVLTEKIRCELGNGQVMCVYDVTALAAGANNVSCETMGLRYIDIAEFHPTVATTSAAATSLFPIMGTNKGTHVTITTVPTAGAGDAGAIVAYGY